MAVTAGAQPPAPRRDPFVRGPADAVLTAALAGVLAWVAWRGLRFVLVTGEWEIVRVNLTNLLVGLFPRDLLWRPVVALGLSVAAVAFAAGAARTAAGGRRPQRRAPAAARDVVGAVWPVLVLVVVLAVLATSAVPVLALAVLGLLAAGAAAAGRRVPRERLRWAGLGALAGLAAAASSLVAWGGPGWEALGGLLLTLWLALAGILLSFPAGVVLALGRRSALPAVRAVCAGYIELVRGVPLVALLFVGSLVIGYFLPPGADAPGLVTRALIAIVAFTAAYVAEIVRGGLQSVPRGQVDAALALGLRPVVVVLPQALRAVIPALVGQFITLFKDTSLVAVIGLFDLLTAARAVTVQPAFLGQGLHAESLGFASFVYWVGAYSMSRASRRLEARLGVGTR